MNRRNFMKLLGLTPFAGLLGCEVKLVAKKPDLPIAKFDPERSYRNWVVITDIKDLDKAWEIVLENAKSIIPPEYHDKISMNDTFYPNHGNGDPIRVIGWYYNIEWKDYPAWRGNA